MKQTDDILVFTSAEKELLLNTLYTLIIENNMSNISEISQEDRHMILRSVIRMLKQTCEDYKPLYTKKTFFIQKDIVQAFDRQCATKNVKIQQELSKLVERFLQDVKDKKIAIYPPQHDSGKSYQKKTYSLKTSVLNEFIDYCKLQNFPQGPMLQSIIVSYM